MILTVNIGLIEQGALTMGWSDSPARNVRFIGATPRSAGVARGVAHRTRHAPPSAGSRCAIRIRHSARSRRAATPIRRPRRGSTLAGSAIASVGSSLKFALVASGEADVYPRTGPTMEWDTAAGALLRGRRHDADPGQPSVPLWQAGFRGNTGFCRGGRYRLCAAAAVHPRLRSPGKVRSSHE